RKVVKTKNLIHARLSYTSTSRVLGLKLLVVRLFPNLLTHLLCFVALTVRAVQPASTNSVPMQIVTCRDDVDTEALLKEFHISLKNPKHHYRALRGFAAPLDAPTIKRLKSDHRVLYVEADGPVTTCD